MTYDYKKWTKEDVERLLQGIDYEAAKKNTYAFNYYFDENTELGQAEIAIFIVMEWVREDKDHNIKGSTVRGTKRMGWFWDGYSARLDREEYGDVGDHSLISEREANEALEKMGLNLDDAKRYLVDSFIKVNGYAPVMLPNDPKWEARRNAALERKK